MPRVSTELAAEIGKLASEEAIRLNHNYVGTEHLLLGLLHQKGSMANRILAHLNVDPDGIRGQVEHIIGSGEKPVRESDISLTPRARRVLELAQQEAGRFNHAYLCTGHMLLALLREGEGIAAGVLEGEGLSLEKARRAMRVLFPDNEYQQESVKPTTESSSGFVMRVTISPKDRRKITAFAPLEEVFIDLAIDEETLEEFLRMFRNRLQQ